LDEIILGKGTKLLLMGSKAYKAPELPKVVKQLLNAAIKERMFIIVGEAPGANQRYQDYLHNQGYRDVIVGHARSLRYNAGNWPDIRYGDNLSERERNMIKDCDSAIIIWVNQSGQIAQNLERLKWLQKPTFLYECSSYSDDVRLGPLDPNRVYQSYLHRKYRAKYGKPPIR
jgi:hypothetical protein